MKARVHLIRRITIPLLAVLLSVASFAHGGPTNSPAKSDKSSKPAKTPSVTKEAVTNATRVEATLPLEIPKSVFLIPTNPAAGKDPFFPRSLYPYGTTVVTPTSKTNTPVVVPDLVLNGLSGTPERPLAIINGYTFGVGDNRDVPFPGGKRLAVQCLEINLQTGTVVVQVSGQRRVLQFNQGKPGK